MKQEFELSDLYNMLEQYQGFVSNGIEITSPIHRNGPEMCMQLIKYMTTDAYQTAFDDGAEFVANLEGCSWK